MAFNGRPREYQSVDDFNAKVEEYFKEIEDANEESMRKFGKLCRAPNIAGLCLHLEISKETFYNYAKRVDGKNQSFVDSIKRASQALESYKLEKASLGQLKEITTIFDLKNNHGYVDKQELTLNETGDKLTAEEIKQRLKAKKEVK